MRLRDLILQTLFLIGFFILIIISYKLNTEDNGTFIERWQNYRNGIVNEPGKKYYP